MNMKLILALVFLVCFAVPAGCGGSEDADASGIVEDTSQAIHSHDVEAEHGTPPDDHGTGGRSAEQDHSGAYNLIEDARSTADEANERIHEMESTLEDL